jgi:bifunctional non-homologous end joining protein LigD
MTGTAIEIEGHVLSLSNLDKALYPSGFTKAQVIDYYVRIAPVLLPYLAERNLTTVRFPDGSMGKSFFSKNIPSYAPAWMDRIDLKDNTYVVCSNLASLVFLANLAALELHVPLHRVAGRPKGESGEAPTPDRIVFDLDPGPETSIKECCQVAILIAEILESLGMTMRAKTSGSKGMQLYAIPPAPMPYDTAAGVTAFAKAVAEGLERSHPDKIVAKQAKDLRPGKVLIDWSQNVRAKTTICVYSLRARDEPTVSTPITWQEVLAGSEGAPLRFTADQVLARVDQFGDLFAVSPTTVTATTV